MIRILGQRNSDFQELIEMQSIDCVKPNNKNMSKTGGKPGKRPGGNKGGGNK